MNRTAHLVFALSLSVAALANAHPAHACAMYIPEPVQVEVAPRPNAPVQPVANAPVAPIAPVQAAAEPTELQRAMALIDQVGRIAEAEMAPAAPLHQAGAATGEATLGKAELNPPPAAIAEVSR